MKPINGVRMNNQNAWDLFVQDIGLEEVLKKDKAIRRVAGALTFFGVVVALFDVFYLDNSQVPAAWWAFNVFAVITLLLLSSTGLSATGTGQLLKADYLSDSLKGIVYDRLEDDRTISIAQLKRIFHNAPPDSVVLSAANGISVQEADRGNAIKTLRTTIDRKWPSSLAESIALHEALDLIEYRTIEHRNEVVKHGFNDFLGCFTNCPYEDEQDKHDWAEGFIMASHSAYVRNHKDHFEGCPFDTAEAVVAKALNQ
ncbi:hypothetical protein [Halomonas sp. 3A7M]|uniref:hypothetical protein n=1 Tax=Halomonas sp. 3A7M TaxID=2742616 RepID=UPI00186703AE|nr:hypothetical protein [Halomonas sp. 3A7M]